MSCCIFIFFSFRLYSLIFRSIHFYLWSIVNLKVFLVKNCVLCVFWSVFDWVQFLIVKQWLSASTIENRTLSLVFFLEIFIRYCLVWWFVAVKFFVGFHHTKSNKDCWYIKSDNKQTKDGKKIFHSFFFFCFFDRNINFCFHLFCRCLNLNISLFLSSFLFFFLKMLISSTTLIFIKCQKRCQMIHYIRD